MLEGRRDLTDGGKSGERYGRRLVAPQATGMEQAEEMKTADGDQLPPGSGTRTSTRTPRSPCSTSCPPSARTRSRMPTRPVPVVVSAPCVMR